MYIFDPYQLRKIARKSSHASETCLNGHVAVLFYRCKSKKCQHFWFIWSLAL